MKTQIIENSDEIILRYVPVGKLILVIFLIILSSFSFLWLIYSNSSDSNNVAPFRSEAWLAILPILAFAAIIILISVINSVIDIDLISLILAVLMIFTLSKKTKSIDILRQGIYGKDIQRYYFHQIKNFKSYKARAIFSSKYFLSVILINKKEIKLKIPICKDKQETVKFIKKLNKIIKSQNSQQSIID